MHAGGLNRTGRMHTSCNLRLTYLLSVTDKDSAITPECATWHTRGLLSEMWSFYLWQFYDFSHLSTSVIWQSFKTFFLNMSTNKKLVSSTMVNIIVHILQLYDTYTRNVILSKSILHTCLPNL